VPRIVPPGQPWPEERRLQKGGRGPRRATNSFDCLRATTSAHGYTFRTRVSATARFSGEDSGYGQHKVGSSWGLDHTAGGRSVAIRVFRPKASRGRPHQAGEPASHRGGAELQEFHVARRGDVALHGPAGDVDHGTCGWREIADHCGRRSCTNENEPRTASLRVPVGADLVPGRRDSRGSHRDALSHSAARRRCTNKK
jgi:hypothetical protein